MAQIEAFKFTAPIPPSINKAYATNWKTKRRHLTKETSAYKVSIRSLLLTKKYKTFTHDIELWLHFAFKDNRIRDISNYIKILEDCLVENKVIIDDSKVDLLIVSRSAKDKDYPNVEVIIFGEINEKN